MGHNNIQEKCMVCIECLSCTGYGAGCCNNDDPDRKGGVECGCGRGKSGCNKCFKCLKCQKKRSKKKKKKKKKKEKNLGKGWSHSGHYACDQHGYCMTDGSGSFKGRHERCTASKSHKGSGCMLCPVNGHHWKCCLGDHSSPGCVPPKGGAGGDVVSFKCISANGIALRKSANIDDR